MTDFYDRLLVEQKEINEKIGNLIKFLDTKECPASDTQKTLLGLQVGHMKHYASCLNLRIEDLKTSKTAA